MGKFAARDGWVCQAYRFALDPTPRQEQTLRSHAGAHRYAWNRGLRLCQERYTAEGKWYSAAELHRMWNRDKKTDPELAWWSSNSKCVYQAIGVDLGVTTLLTGVDDQGQVVTVPGPRALNSSLRRLRCASRAHGRKAKGSANRAKAAVRLARVHARVANVRADALHQATSGLAARYQTIVAEDLNVTGMLANRRLARAVADQGFATARRMLGYKTTWNGGRLITADRWYPSSKTCSGCGWRKPSLTLSERTFRCQACGFAAGRDVNAATNLLKLAPGTASGAGTGPGSGPKPRGAAVRPGLARRAAVNQEPGIPHESKTGTVAGQPAAAGVCAH